MEVSECKPRPEDVFLVDKVTDSEYKPRHLDIGYGKRAIYGGQTIAQSLLAAYQSISDLNSNFVLHSLHCYYIGPLQKGSDIIYRVDRVKVGVNFISLLVKAMQSSKIKFHCMVSFKQPGPSSGVFDYCTKEMPNVPRPPAKDGEYLDDRLAPLHFDFAALEFHRVERDISFNAEPRDLYWIRLVPHSKSSCEDQNIQRIKLVYASDMARCRVIHKSKDNGEEIFFNSLVASLDHGMWFYEDIDASLWYLHDITLEHSHNERVLTSTRIYLESGKLVAICNQEAVCKPKL